MSVRPCLSGGGTGGALTLSCHFQLNLCRFCVQLEASETLEDARVTLKKGNQTCGRCWTDYLLIVYRYTLLVRPDCLLIVYQWNRKVKALGLGADIGAEASVGGAVPGPRWRGLTHGGS